MECDEERSESVKTQGVKIVRGYYFMLQQNSIVDLHFPHKHATELSKRITNHEGRNSSVFNRSHAIGDQMHPNFYKLVSEAYVHSLMYENVELHRRPRKTFASFDIRVLNVELRKVRPRCGSSYTMTNFRLKLSLPNNPVR
jgi:hypothetical protein